jgi:formylmethanofuran dehydrogenase subunit E
MGQLYQGIPREQIPWFPIINPERCDEAMAEPYARMAEAKLLCVPCCGYGW